jgi:hypothetical protein
MKNKKAYIKVDGEIGEKEQSAIEYVDLKYLDKINKQKKDLNDLLTKMKNDQSRHKPA